MCRVLPDQKNSVHYWNEEVSDLREFFGWIDELKEEIFKSFEVLVVLVGLISCCLNFFLELAEWSSVGGFVLLEELQNLLDLLRVELVANGVEVLALVLPEIYFSSWIWMVTILQGNLWVLLEDVLNLFSPVDDCTLEDLCLVFA